jgi:hypothetical protein
VASQSTRAGLGHHQSAAVPQKAKANRQSQYQGEIIRNPAHFILL